VIYVGIGALVLAALLIGFWVWTRHAIDEDFRQMRHAARRSTFIAEEWESPHIVATYGGIHDVEEDGW
jgi:hypothetical protein